MPSTTGGEQKMSVKSLTKSLTFAIEFSCLLLCFTLILSLQTSHMFLIQTFLDHRASWGKELLVELWIDRWRYRSLTHHMKYETTLSLLLMDHWWYRRMLLYYFHPGLYFALNSVYIILVSSITFPPRVILCSNPVKKLFHNRVSSSKISVHKKVAGCDWIWDKIR